jgi:hypothetical protein
MIHELNLGHDYTSLRDYVANLLSRCMRVHCPHWSLLSLDKDKDSNGTQERSSQHHGALSKKENYKPVLQCRRPRAPGKAATNASPWSSSPPGVPGQQQTEWDGLHDHTSTPELV